MPVHAALLPSLATSVGRSVCVVVDVLRATTTLTALLDAGCTDIVVSETVDEATELAAMESRLICGEQGGLPPAHFHYGNSPRQFVDSDLSGKAIAFATTNGTRALQVARTAPVVLAGCVRNASAVASAAVAAAARRGLDVQVICAGRGRGREFALDDAVCAGLIVDRIAAFAGRTEGPQHPQQAVAEDAEVDDVTRWGLTDCALGLRALYRAYLADSGTEELAVFQAFQQSASGRGLARIGLAEDVNFCARPDVSRTVPVASLSGSRVVVSRL